MSINRPSSAISSSTTLRPRARRQAHENDETISFSATDSRWLDGTATSSSSLRAESPTNLSLSSRADEEAQRHGNSRRFLGASGVIGSRSNPSAVATALWESSWCSLQGFASNFIGGDSSRASSPGHSKQRRQRPIGGTYGSNTSASPSQWGPSGGERQVGLGTQEDQRMLLQARKRETLLAANDHVVLDVSGRYKRRDSDERNDTLALPGEQDDRDALVYLHKVKPEDTSAGIMIKYSCQPNVFRKANRLWPNDSIQVRKTVLLPVEACGVRGRRIIESSRSTERLRNTEEIMPTPTAFQPPWSDLHDSPKERGTPLSSIPTSPSMSISFSNPEEPPWKHDSWVMIDGFSDAVEIARLSQKTLGYFPRSRRKSLTFSDVETPPASLDLPRGSYQSSPPRGRISQSRSSSGCNPTHQLQGPGGVGTMGKDVRSPGPAQDGLNKLFATHLPNLAPRKSFESVNSSSSHGNGGIEHVGGAIEGWMRKLATKAANSIQPQTPGGRSWEGDLIELSEDAFEIGDDDHAGDGDWRSTTRFGPTRTWSAERGSLRQNHFPPKERLFEESPRSGKSD